MYHVVATWRGPYVQDRDSPAGSQPRSARRPPHAAAAPPALCTAVASKKKDVPEQQRAFAINPVLEQVTRSFQKIMGTLYRARRDFLGVVVVVERRGDKEGGFGSANERSRSILYRLKTFYAQFEGDDASGGPRARKCRKN